MKRIWLGILLLVVAVAFIWWALGRDGGPAIRSFNLSVVGQTLYGAGPGGAVRVRLGDQVTIHISADEPMEVFLHGYDLETRVRPDADGTMEFTASILGRHPLMIHELGEDQGSHRKVEVLLGFIEVLPGK